MKVLIVEDEPFCHELIKRTLESAGMQTHSSHNVEEGINALKEQDFDLVITDIIMPGRHGTELIQHIKDCDYPLPVLAVTAGYENATEDYVNQAEMFADKAISKPFVKSELVKIVEDLVSASRCVV